MQDLIGRTLGHYRIVEKIGEGGMGVVYRAHDERLDRDVAIKVLPETVAQDADRLARFEREAKLLASLNHQNVATLHGLDEHEGQRFLVMELVEGESLAGVLARGAIPVDDALPIALQITEGLEAAHERGIIHRDLKPANVMVSPEGEVKVLDFGLAKAWHHDESDADLTHSPTLTAQMTAAGVLLGTAAYMSPEQARGKAVDKRADVWAFGCVFYEMLAGTRAFAGESATDILATIIKDNPDWDALPVETPPPIRRLLRRCLTKDPHDRIHDIADARIMLQSLSTDDYSKDESAASALIRPGWRKWLPWGITAAIAVLFAAVLVRVPRAPVPGTVARLFVGVEPAEWLGSDRSGRVNDQSYRLSNTAMDISPDGRLLVYCAGGEEGSRLYLRALDEVRGAPIAGTEGGVGPFFSPDGEWIGFWADAALKKVRIDGSPPVTVCDAEWPPYGASWGPSDIIVFGQNEGGIQRVSAEGGEPEAITTLMEDEFRHSHPRVLSDGETMFFTVRQRESGEVNETTIVAQSLPTGERKILVENGADARFASTGHLVFARAGALMAAAFDPERVEVTGGAVVVLESVRQGVNAENTAWNTMSGQFAFSPSGILVHVPGGVWSDRKHSLVWVDHEGVVQPLSTPPGAYYAPRLSPDGSRVVVSPWGFNHQDIWVHDLARGTFSRLTFEDFLEGYPTWTPDGDRITFTSDRSGRYDVYEIPADGSGFLEHPAALENAFPVSWSPNGGVLSCVRQTAERGQVSIWMLPREGEPWPFIKSQFWESSPTFSPDGRWLAYTSQQSGRFEVYVTPYPGPGPRVQISSDGGVSPAWAPNGGELYFLGPHDTDGRVSMWVVDITMEPDLSVGDSRTLFKGHYLREVFTRSYDVAPDGKKFLMVARGPEPDEPVTHMHVTLNWFEELKRLVPTE